MAFPTTQINELFHLGILPNFKQAYERTAGGVDKRLGQYMQLGVGSNAKSSPYAYMTSAPVARYAPKGMAIPTDASSAKIFRTPNWPFGISSALDLDDEGNDQLGLAKQRASESGATFAYLPERSFYALLTGGAVGDIGQLQPIFPTAPDGVGFFSALDGAGANRFGALGGNIISGFGVGSSQAIKSMILAAFIRYGQFQDTQGQPLQNPEEIATQGLGMFYNVANMTVVKEATENFYNLEVQGGAFAGITNLIQAANLSVQCIPTQKITSNTSYFAKRGGQFGPFWQTRYGLRVWWANPGNSDIANEFNLTKVYARMSGGIGLMLPLDWIQGS